MKHARKPLAGDSVQNGNHQHKALRRGKACRERAALKRAVYRRRSAGLRLHLHEPHSLPEQIFLSFCGPQIRLSGHRRRRRDRINRGNFRKGIGNVSSRFVAVDSNILFLSAHKRTPSICHQAVSMLASFSSPSFFTACSRILNFWILPASFIGKPSTKSIYFGTLCLAM